MHSLEAFLRKYRRLFIVMGLMIVMLTYVVKDGLKEYEKDQIDALKDAQNEQRLAGYHHELMNAIHSGPDQPPVPPDVSEFSKSFEGPTQWEAWVMLQQVISTDFDLSLVGADAVAMRWKANEEMQRLRGRAYHEASTLRSMSGEGNALFQMTFPDATEKRVSREQDLFVQKAFAQRQKAQSAITTYVAWVIAHIAGEKYLAQLRYERFRMLSYCLFGFGWIVSLIGALFDIEVPSKAA